MGSPFTSTLVPEALVLGIVASNRTTLARSSSPPLLGLAAFVLLLLGGAQVYDLTVLQLPLLQWVGAPAAPLAYVVGLKVLLPSLPKEAPKWASHAFLLHAISTALSSTLLFSSLISLSSDLELALRVLLVPALSFVAIAFIVSVDVLALDNPQSLQKKKRK